LIISDLQLKNRLLKILLVFSSKIEDLTLSFVAYLKTEGKWGNRSLSSRNLRFAKIKHIGDNFTDSGCKMEGRFTDSSTDFGVYFLWFGRASIALHLG